MIFSSSHLLGIAVADRAIAVAEVTGKGDRASVRRAATFTLPPDLSLDKPETLGPAFAAFLREKEFSSSHAVVGVPAKWLIAVEKEIPPASRDQVHALLRLQAERLPLAENGELVFDYAGQRDSGKPAKVLLVAMLRKQFERIILAMKAAELDVEAVTPTALALASVAGGRSDGPRHSAPMLVLGRHGAEVVLQRQGVPRMLRHVGVGASNGHGVPALGSLGTEVRRAVATAPLSSNGHAGGSPAVEDLVLWDTVGLDSANVAELSERVGMKVRSGDALAMLGVRSAAPKTSQDGSPSRLAPAVALAMVGADRALLPLDFAKSRLAPPQVRRFGRKSMWMTVVGAVVVLLLGGFWVDIYMRESVLSRIQKDTRDLLPKTQEAQAVKDRVDFTNLFFKTRTPMLDCLLEMSQVFHDDERNIWASSFTIKEDTDSKVTGKAEGRLEGKTTDPGLVTALAERMKTNPKFSNVRVIEVGTAGGRGRDERPFNITFVFDPAGK